MKPGYERTNDRKDWRTPETLFRVCSERWGPFDMDVAASEKNAMCHCYYTEERDALAHPWVGRIWCNPPYGRGIERWLLHGYKEVYEGRAKRIVYLLPARTDTRWFQHWALRSDVMTLFLPGRITFEGAAAPAPFPSCLVIFDSAAIRPMRVEP